MQNRNNSSLTDNEVIALIVNEHQQEWYEVLYNRYHSKVLDKCYALLKNREQAEEFTEDIFSKVYEKLDTFSFRSAFSSWLYSITYNQCIDYLRNKKKLHYPEWNARHELPEIIDESEEDLSGIRYDNLIIILEQIHPEEKALLLMKYQDNLSLKAIGAALRISESVAKMRIKRAKARVLYLYKQKFSFGN
jgi:RNA polymerase sigma factor (sigma-70 family)